MRRPSRSLTEARLPSRSRGRASAKAWRGRCGLGKRSNRERGGDENHVRNSFDRRPAAPPRRQARRMRMGHVASARVRSRPYQGAEAPHQRMGLLPGERRRVRCGADRRRYGLRGAHLGIGDGFRAGHVAYGQRDLAVSDGALQAARHLGRGRDLLREQPRIVPLRGCRRAAPPQRVVRGLRRRRRPDVRGRAGRGAARFDGESAPW